MNRSPLQLLGKNTVEPKKTKRKTKKLDKNINSDLSAPPSPVGRLSTKESLRASPPPVSIPKGNALPPRLYLQ
jgi:hypothetical protein